MRWAVNGFRGVDGTDGRVIRSRCLLQEQIADRDPFNLFPGRPLGPVDSLAFATAGLASVHITLSVDRSGVGMHRAARGRAI